jgi:non-specific serine/threonine protein kinase
MMLPFASRSVIAGNGAGHLGVMSHYLGMTAAVAGRPAEADDWYAHALARYERMNAKPLVARALADRAVVSSAGQTARVTMLERAGTIAREIGMVRTMQRAEALLAMVRERRAVQHVARPAGDRASRECRFHNEGQYWTIVFRGAVVRLRDAKGMRCLAELLRAPGRDLHAQELDTAGAAPPVRTHARDGLSIDAGRADPLLDRRAKAEYRARLADLKAQIDEAENAGDLGRAAKSRNELELVEQALMAATGLRGRDRASGVRAERARLNVTRAVRTAMRAIAAAHPALGRHLAASIKTGRLCRYEPSAEDDVSWTF